MKPTRTDGPVRLSGTLTVTERDGARGPFNVGELATPLGDFKVIDQWLEQLDPGSYKGDFWVSRVEPRSNVWKNRVFVEIRATVVDYSLEEDHENVTSHTNSVPPEPDPIEDDRRSKSSSETPKNTTTNAIRFRRPVPSPAATPNRNDQPSRTASSQSRSDSAEIGELFGHELAPLVITRVDAIKLDPTVDRELFRKQKSWLKEHQYRFDVAEQIWNPPTT
ncbi:MAG: DUF3275 family protein [Aquabacterium sp.]